MNTVQVPSLDLGTQPYEGKIIYSEGHRTDLQNHWGQNEDNRYGKGHKESRSQLHGFPGLSAYLYVSADRQSMRQLQSHGKGI